LNQDAILMQYICFSYATKKVFLCLRQMANNLSRHRNWK